MTLSGALGTWEWLLRADGGPRGRVMKQRLFAVPSRVPSQCVVLTMDVLVFLGMCFARSLAEVSGPSSMWSGFYSCQSAQMVFRVRGERLRTILGGTALVAKSVEDASCDKGKAVLRRAASRNRLMTTQCLVLGGALVASISVTVIATGRFYATVWPVPPPGWPTSLVGLLQVVSLLLGCSAYYLMCSLVGCLGISIAGLYRALALQLRNARTPHQVVRAVQLHQALLTQAHSVEAFFSDVLMHLLFCCFTCPLASTVDVLFGNVEPATFGVAPLLASVFLPFSFISQELADASLAIGDAAFVTAARSDRDSPAAEVAVRRALVLTMAASRRPSRLSCKGLGPLSLPAAANALRTWYSLVSVLVSSARR